MIDIFDPHYDVESKEVIFHEYNKNKLIDGNMINVIGDNYKHNSI